MLIITFFASIFGVMISEEEHDQSPQITFFRCLKDFGIKIGKTWMHYMLIISMSCKLKIALITEILAHFVLFSISNIFKDQLTVYGQFALLEASSILFFSFLDILKCCSPTFYIHITQLVFFYLANVIFFFSLIPDLIVSFAIFGAIHFLVIVAYFKKQFLLSKYSASLSYAYEKVINLGLVGGNNCVLVQKTNPKRIELLELKEQGTNKIISTLFLKQDSAILRSFHSSSKLVHVQASNMLYLYTLPSFKLVKMFDMGNSEIETSESIRHVPSSQNVNKNNQSPQTPQINKREKLNQIQGQDLHIIVTLPDGTPHSSMGENPSCSNSPFIVRGENKALLGDSPIKSPNFKKDKKDNYQIMNDAHHHDEENENQEKMLSQAKLYIPHEDQPLIAEISTIGNETQIRIINYLRNFEERKLMISIPIRRQEQLLQFVRIDESDKIFFKSEVNSFCLIDINKNISEIVRQRAEDAIQCSIINERDLILAENNFIYLYDIPASLFVKKISKFHSGSHLLPILNAPGFYIVVPSEAHCHIISPEVEELVNENFHSHQMVSSKFCSSLGIRQVIYDSQHSQLFIFSKSQIMVQKNIHLRKAEQPQISDHVVLDVSIYQQQEKDYA